MQPKRIQKIFRRILNGFRWHEEPRVLTDASEVPTNVELWQIVDRVVKLLLLFLKICD